MQFFKNKTVFVLSFLLLAGITLSQTKIEVGPVYLGEVEGEAFYISENGKIRVEGHNSEYDRKSNYTFYGWILRSSDRSVVWHSIEDSDNYDEDGIYRFSAELELDKGDYEVYYTGIKGSYNNNYDFGDLLSDIFGSKKKRSFRRNKDKLKISVEGDFVQKRDISDIIDKCVKHSIISVNRAGDDEVVKKNFNLKKATDIRIYYMGEGEKREFYDYAWIYNLDTREKIWSVNYRNTDHAGGARKNLVVDENITLPAGNYELNYVTDDSHSFDEWNQLPPMDPYFYGITIWPENKADLANLGNFVKTKEMEPVVDLTKVGDEKLKEAGFRVKKEMDFRILCLGEQGYSRNMVDYGWIIDADTKEIVWEMRKEDTEYAGGAKKNRMVDDIFTIEKGNYIVYYVTDDSHSYRRWNDSKPYSPENWGISIWASDKKDYKYVETFDPAEYRSDKVIVEILRVRSDKCLSKKFELNKKTSVRIIALGEGERREMFDYAWIENLDNGRTVWEMRYRNTEHAGGARKNRIFNDTITLNKGRYKVYYETDDSHAYRDWNTTPPRNPESYGVSILVEK